MSGTPFLGLSLAELGRPDIAEAALSASLHRGELALLLGAGVSMSSQLPSWRKLVRNCEDELGLSNPLPEEADERTGAQLMDSMEAVRRRVLDAGGSEAGFRQLVRTHLYPSHLVTAATYDDASLQNLMLIALGALIMPSKRGAISTISTLNFDDLLEWYLELHGFRTQSITEMPTLVRGDVDATVVHLHGFLPLREGRYRQTDWLVLTHAEFVRRLARDRAWRRFVESLVASKTLLIIGSSFSDIDIQVALEAVREDRQGDDPLGFVVADEFSPEEDSRLVESGLVPVAVGSREQIPHFLLAVCRAAASLA